MNSGYREVISEKSTYEQIFDRESFLHDFLLDFSPLFARDPGLVRQGAALVLLSPDCDLAPVEQLTVVEPSVLEFYLDRSLLRDLETRVPFFDTVDEYVVEGALEGGVVDVFPPEGCVDVEKDIGSRELVFPKIEVPIEITARGHV